MTLIDMVKDLGSLDREMTIYAAEPWTENSKAITVPDHASGRLPPEAEQLGLTYFLEVFIAREVLDDWTESLGEDSTLQEQCVRLIKYAIDDA